MKPQRNLNQTSIEPQSKEHVCALCGQQQQVIDVHCDRKRFLKFVVANLLSICCNVLMRKAMKDRNE